MFIKCRFSTSDKNISISSRVSDLQKIINTRGYSNCSQAFQNTKYANKVTDALSIVKSDTLASLAIVFMQDTSVLSEKEIEWASINSPILEISARTKNAFTLCIEEFDIGSLTFLCRKIVRNSPFLEKVRITADSEDLNSVKEFGGVEIIYRQES